MFNKKRIEELEKRTRARLNEIEMRIDELENRSEYLLGYKEPHSPFRPQYNKITVKDVVQKILYHFDLRVETVPEKTEQHNLVVITPVKKKK